MVSRSWLFGTALAASLVAGCIKGFPSTADSADAGASDASDASVGSDAANDVGADTTAEADASDASDGSDGNDALDASDADAADASDAADALDASDASDATDGSVEAGCTTGDKRCNSGSVQTCSEGVWGGDVACTANAAQHVASVTCDFVKAECVVSSCSGGWENCSGGYVDGCEADLTQSAHCGTCSNVCTASQTCNSGTTCVNTICTFGVSNFGDKCLFAP